MSLLYEDTLKQIKREIDEALSASKNGVDPALIKKVDFMFEMIMKQKMIIGSLYSGTEKWLLSYMEKLDELMHLIDLIKKK
ncbi:hypothetical protein [Bacillus sp. Brlt_9]|uniref:hypothetical protein n=1 Tax=Bacillus sp. Brlt_9 TaxID=3110916 RepID=UPI003F7B6CDF